MSVALHPTARRAGCRPGSAAFEQPAGWARRAALPNPSAAHEIRIGYDWIGCACGWGIRATPADTDGDPHRFWQEHHPAAAR